MSLRQLHAGMWCGSSHSLKTTVVALGIDIENELQRLDLGRRTPSQKRQVV